MAPNDYALPRRCAPLMIVIIWLFRRFITDVSDYFRSGGQVLWRMAGASAFMVLFCAWTFTGASYSWRTARKYRHKIQLNLTNVLDEVYTFGSAGQGQRVGGSLTYDLQF